MSNFRTDIYGDGLAGRYAMAADCCTLRTEHSARLARRLLCRAYNEADRKLWDGYARRRLWEAHRRNLDAVYSAFPALVWITGDGSKDWEPRTRHVNRSRSYFAGRHKWRHMSRRARREYLMWQSALDEDRRDYHHTALVYHAYPDPVDDSKRHREHADRW